MQSPLTSLRDGECVGGCRAKHSHQMFTVCLMESADHWAGTRAWAITHEGRQTDKILDPPVCRFPKTRRERRETRRATPQNTGTAAAFVLYPRIIFKRIQITTISADCWKSIIRPLCRCAHWKLCRFCEGVIPMWMQVAVMAVGQVFL